MSCHHFPYTNENRSSNNHKSNEPLTRNVVPAQAFDSQFEEENGSSDEGNELVRQIKNKEGMGTGGSGQKTSQIVKRVANTETEHQDTIQKALRTNQSIITRTAVVAEVGESQHLSPTREQDSSTRIVKTVCRK